MLKESGDKILCPFPEPMDWQFPSGYLKEIPDLKAICLSTTSYHWIDGKLARSLGINLTHVPNPPNAVAEGAITMMMVVARRYITTIRGEQFEFKPDNFLTEVKGKTMGVIGLGKIGTRIAELGQALGMKVVYWSRCSRSDKFTFQELDRLLSTANFVFPCVKLNEETRNLLSARKMDLMKPNASLISIVPQAIIDLDHLIKKVENDELYGCAFEQDGKELKEYQGNIFTTLHNNWYTKETVQAKMQMWIDNIVGCIEGKPVNLVN